MEESTEIKIKESKPNAKNFMIAYKEALPDLISQNTALQDRALKIVAEKIDQANAVQAATIYGILSDKMTGLLAQRSEGNNTFNMYFGKEKMDPKEMAELMGKVMHRIKSEDAVDVED